VKDGGAEVVSTVGHLGQQAGDGIVHVIQGIGHLAESAGGDVANVAEAAYHGLSIFGNAVANGVGSIDADVVECCIGCCHVTAQVACGFGHVLGALLSVLE
jgi:hypothetical protein